MPAKALVILANGFEEIEAIAPVDIMRRAGIEVTTAGLDAEMVTSSRHQTVFADSRFGEVSGDYDAVILPGGMPGAKNLADSPPVKALVADLHSRGKVIAAICAAPALVLAPLGILDGKNATCFPGMEKEFGPQVRFQDQRVVVDGNVITSRAAGTAIGFSLAIVERLVGKAARDRVAAAILAD